jgi:hypothetical protein
MNRKAHGWIVILSAISGAVLSQSAVAENIQTTKAAVSLDWSNLQLSVTGPNGVAPHVEYSNPRTTLFTHNNSGGADQRSARNWTESISADSVSENEQAHALASASVFSGNTEATADTDGFGILAEANVHGTREIDYTIDGPGAITVSVPYTLSKSGCNLDYECAAFEQKAYIVTQASFVPGFGPGYPAFTDDGVSLDHEGSQSGNLIFWISSGEPGHGTLSIYFNVLSSVPEPETYAMLLAGLGLVGFIARWKNKHREVIFLDTRLAQMNPDGPALGVFLFGGSRTTGSWTSTTTLNSARPYRKLRASQWFCLA